MTSLTAEILEGESYQPLLRKDLFVASFTVGNRKQEQMVPKKSEYKLYYEIVVDRRKNEAAIVDLNIPRGQEEKHRGDPRNFEKNLKSTFCFLCKL